MTLQEQATRALQHVVGLERMAAATEGAGKDGYELAVLLRQAVADIQQLAEAVQQALGSAPPLRRYWVGENNLGESCHGEDVDGEWVKFADVARSRLALQQIRFTEGPLKFIQERVERQEREGHVYDSVECATADRAELWRFLTTEHAQHEAWRKRGTEAEAQLAAAQQEIARLNSELSTLKSQVEAAQIARTRLQDALRLIEDEAENDPLIWTIAHQALAGSPPGDPIQP